MRNGESFITYMKNAYFLIILVLSHPVFAVDINTATREELADELFGIGLVKAQRIIEYRDKIGGFISAEQLIEVYGIGPKTLERNREKIEISPLFKVNSSNPPPKEKTKLQNTLLTLSPQNHQASPSKKLQPNRSTDANLDLSPKIEKPSRQAHNLFWDALIIIPLFIVCLLIFAIMWLKSAKKDKSIPRKHLVNTTFVCSGCGKVSSFQNLRYEGHFSHFYIDGELPPGWTCIPNWLGKPCDYCFDCSR